MKLRRFLVVAVLCAGSASLAQGAELRKLENHGRYQNIGDFDVARLRLHGIAVTQGVSGGWGLTSGLSWNMSYRFHQFFKIGTHLGAMPLRDEARNKTFPVGELFVVPALWMGILYVEIGVGAAAWMPLGNEPLTVMPAGMLHLGVRLKEWFWDAINPGVFLAYSTHLVPRDFASVLRVGVEIGL